MLVLLSILISLSSHAALVDFTQTGDDVDYFRRIKQLAPGDEIAFFSEGKLRIIGLEKELGVGQGFGSRVFSIKGSNEKQIVKISKTPTPPTPNFSLIAEARSLEAHRAMGILAPQVDLISDQQQILVKAFAPGELGTRLVEEIENMPATETLNRLLALETLFSIYEENLIYPTDLTPSNFTFVEDGNRVEVFDPGPLARRSWQEGISYRKALVHFRFTAMSLWAAILYFKSIDTDVDNHKLKLRMQNLLSEMGGFDTAHFAKLLYFENDKEHLPLRKAILKSMNYFSKEFKYFEGPQSINSGDLESLKAELVKRLLATQTPVEFLNLKNRIIKLKFPNANEILNLNSVLAHFSKLNPNRAEQFLGRFEMASKFLVGVRNMFSFPSNASSSSSCIALFN